MAGRLWLAEESLVRVVTLAWSRSLGDRGDFRVVNGWARHTGWLHGFMADVATYGVLAFAALLLAGWWVARRAGDPRRMAAALWAPLGALLAVAVNQPIVGAVHEQRPFVALPRTLLLVHHSVDPGFPSDHATMAGAVAAALWFVDRRLFAGAAVAAALLGFARVYVGVHYPVDVLAGFALGALVAVAGALLLVPRAAPLVAWLGRTSLRPLLRA